MVSKDSEGYPEQLCATEEISELACPNLYLNREINWLDFDAKVLDEATDAGLPLLEQLKFLSIFYNNLDEFFMVRVANIYRQYRSGAVSSSPDRHDALQTARRNPGARCLFWFPAPRSLAQAAGPAAARQGRTPDALC